MLSPLLIGKTVSLLLLSFFLIGCQVVTQEEPKPSPDINAETRPLLTNLGTLDTLLPPDAIPSIDDPLFEDAEAADASLSADERVIGIEINGHARAYPINILSSHEIVNDVIDGQAIAVTWCPLCYTALVFKRPSGPNNRPLTFGVSGKLLQNTLVMFDRETESLWSQLYGFALDGPLTGAKLEPLAALHTDWATWRAQYPETLVLSKQQTRIQFSRAGFATTPRSSYDVDPYASYYRMPIEGVVDHQIPRDEDSLSPKRRVLGLRIDQQAKAYPFELLAKTPLINDEVAALPVLVWFDTASESGQIFAREVDDQVLTFAQVDGNSLEFVDQETSSRWNGVTGEAKFGPLKGHHLTLLPSTTAFAFGWYGYFPQSDTFARE